MAIQEPHTASPHHPSPGRAAVSNAALWLGLLAAPLAWAIAELILYYMASYFCEMKTYDTAATFASAASPWFIVVSMFAFIVSIAGIWISYKNWAFSKKEKQGPG